MKKKVLSLCLALISTIALNVNAFAADQQITTEGTASVDITANVVSTFEVILPTRIDVVEKTPIPFIINASGSISQKEYLSVDLPDSVTMSAEGETPIVLPITADDEELDAAELSADGGTNINCVLDATDLFSGDWEGSIVVDISLKTTP